MLDRATLDHRRGITRAARRWRPFLVTLVAAAFVFAISTTLAADTCRGSVFADINGNRIRDAEEPALGNVRVSNGEIIVRTDAEGAFQLPLDNSCRFVFISVPTGYHASGDWYVAVPEAADSMVVEFGVSPTPDSDGILTFAQASDIHFAATPEEFREAFYDRAMVVQPQGILDEMVEEVNRFRPDFVILTGDQVADSKNPDISLVESWTEYISQHLIAAIDSPTWAVVGNHEVVRDPAVDRAVFEQAFGPTYYTFDCEGVHCIVLDTHTLTGTSLSYTVSNRQLAWLRADLGSTGAQQPILVFCHEPSSNWVDNDIMSEVKNLLVEFGVSALITGHWHLSYELAREPFLEITSGAVCGSWWEGPAPDGRSFGYRVYRIRRGSVDSVWRTIGEDTVDLASPQTAILSWNDRLHAQTWGEAASVRLAWDDNPSIELDTVSHSLWSAVDTELNVSTLPNGYHTLHIGFDMDDGASRDAEYSFYIWNPTVSLAEILDHPDAFRGRMVAAANLTVRAVLGDDASVNDGTKTIIVGNIPFPVSRNDRIAVMGLFRPTSTDPIKAYDDLFLIKLEEEPENDS